MAKKTAEPPDARIDDAEAALARGEDPKDTRTPAEKKADADAARDPDRIADAPVGVPSSDPQGPSLAPPAPPHEPQATGVVEPAATWSPPGGHIVTDDKDYIVWVGNQRYEHVSEAPDGRWVYKPS